MLRNKKESDENQMRRDGALNQFINELSSNIHGRRYSEAPQSNANVVERKEIHSLSVESTSENCGDEASKTDDKSISQNEPVTDGERQNNSSETLAQPSHFVTVIEVKETSKAPEAERSVSPTTITNKTSHTTAASSSFKSIRSGYENVIIENNKRNSNLINEIDRSSSTSSFNNSSKPSIASIANIQDVKKKIPPR